MTVVQTSHLCSDEHASLHVKRTLRALKRDLFLNSLPYM